MSDILSFLSINTFRSNTAGVVNPVGELSGIGSTFSRDVLHYSSNDGKLSTFDRTPLTAGELAVVNTVEAIVVNDLTTMVLDLSNGTGTLLENVVGGLPIGYSNVVIGAGISNPIDGNLYPSWISFTLDSNGEVWTYKVWLSDTIFRSEFPVHYLDVILPWDNVSDLYDNFSTVKTIIQNISPNYLTDKAANNITAIVTGYATVTLRAYNPQNTSDTVDIPILIAYNGSRNQLTNTIMVGGIKDYLLTNSTIEYDVWSVVIPTLQPVNVFDIIPNWNNISLNNVALATPLYSPTIKTIDASAIHAGYFSEDEVSGFVNSLEYTVAIYNSIGLYAIPSENNPDGRLTWSQKFPDYMLIDINDSNALQLSVKTQTLLYKLDRTLRVAETYVDGDTLSSEFTIINRANKLYISTSFLDIKLNVLTRASI